ncbi:MAG: hypothetical protein WCI77_00145 [Candidatus Omnitrophota bacterium]
MIRCKFCKAPLSGLLSVIGKTVFNIRPSVQDHEVCSKCVGKQPAQSLEEEADNIKAKKYKCQICARAIHQEHALEHIKAEEYLINLIKKDHPQWQIKDVTCKECIEYYRKLIKDAEI